MSLSNTFNRNLEKRLRVFKFFIMLHFFRYHGNYVQNNLHCRIYIYTYIYTLHRSQSVDSSWHELKQRYFWTNCLSRMRNANKSYESHCTRFYTYQGRVETGHMLNRRGVVRRGWLAQWDSVQFASIRLDSRRVRFSTIQSHRLMITSFPFFHIFLLCLSSDKNLNLSKLDIT